MFFSWSMRRRIIIFGGIVAVIAIPVSYALFSYLYVPPSCLDGKRNQGEFGADCGGPCRLLCEEQVSDLVLLWSRAVPALPGVYDAVALFENPNADAGIREISYAFTLYDSRNIIIAEREGKTHVNPNEQFAVYEPGIRTGARIPARTFFEFTGPKRWERADEGMLPGLFVKDRKLRDLGARPRLDATLVNPSFRDVSDVVITAVLFDKDENAVAAGKTEVGFLLRNSSKNVTFSWPEKFTKGPDACLVPLDIMVVFDRSGSMNDDSLDPPQPLTDARGAAETFVETLGTADQVGVVSFATAASDPIDQMLNNDHSFSKTAIRDIGIPPEEETGSTNLGDAIDKATVELLSARNNPDALKIMVILTDGLANEPEDPGGEVYAARKALEAKRNNVTIYAIGLGEKVNAPFLATQIASERKRYYFAEQSDDLFRVYKTVSEVVCPLKTYPMTVLPRINVFK